MSANDELNIERHWPEGYLPDWSALAQSSREDAFGESAFELFKEAGILTTLAAGLVPKVPHDRNKAILGALMVKLAKLGKAIVAMSSHLGSARQ